MKPLQTAKPPGHTVLFNSFETAQDTLSWYWSGDYRLINDTPPSGGNYALEVKGGKVLPAGSFISRPLRYGGYFTIQCWGKVKDIGGYIQLSTIADHEVGEAVRVHILDPHWRFTQSADTLFCPPNQSLMLTIQPGLLKDGTMAVDLIQVQKVGKAGKNSAQNGKRVARR